MLPRHQLLGMAPPPAQSQFTFFIDGKQYTIACAEASRISPILENRIELSRRTNCPKLCAYKFEYIKDPYQMFPKFLDCVQGQNVKMNRALSYFISGVYLELGNATMAATIDASAALNDPWRDSQALERLKLVSDMGLYRFDVIEASAKCWPSIRNSKELLQLSCGVLGALLLKVQPEITWLAQFVQQLISTRGMEFAPMLDVCDWCMNGWVRVPRSIQSDAQPISCEDHSEFVDEEDHSEFVDEEEEEEEEWREEILFRYNIAWDDDEILNGVLKYLSRHDWRNEILIQGGGPKKNLLQYVLPDDDKLYMYWWDSCDKVNGNKSSDAWLCITLLNYRLQINNVTLAISTTPVCRDWPTSWVFEGSNDGKTWTTLRKETNSNDLKPRPDQEPNPKHIDYTGYNVYARCKTMAIAQKDRFGRLQPAFSMFRFRMLDTGLQANKSGFALRVNGIEFYGRLERI